MPRKAKTVRRSYAKLQRDLRTAEKEQSGWIDRYNSIQSQLHETSRKLEHARRQLLAKDIEIGRMQGYIDRVMDEERSRHGTAQNGPTTDTLQRLRHEVLEGSHSLDEMSTDEIERLTGRDD